METNTDADPYKYHLHQEELPSESDNHAECAEPHVSPENETTTLFPELCASGIVNIPAETEDLQQAVENAVDKKLLILPGTAQPLTPIVTLLVNNFGNEQLSESEARQVIERNERSRQVSVNDDRQGIASRRRRRKLSFIDKLILAPQQPSTPSKYRSNIPKGTNKFTYDGKVFTVNIDEFDNSAELGSGSFGACATNGKQVNGRTSEDIELSIMEKVASNNTPYIVNYYCAIVSALRILHTERIIHRDIKPDNMLINKNGIVKLCDFGVSVDLNENPDFFFDGGTESYRPPRPQFPSSIQDDMWALGISLLEIINGQHPFYNVDPNALPFKLPYWEPKVPTTVSNEMQQLIQDLLKRNPEDRPRSYDDILHRSVISNMPQIPSNDERDFVRRIIDKIS
ncbi:unnamed protein product [Rotaria sp. Silwood1]|nr:unnamed protein product [Rotaria sp. Silwood1]